MVSDNQRKLEQRIVRAAEAALAERRFVTAVDVLVGVGWLAPSAVDRWRQGRVDYLEREVQANLHKISTAMALFRRWAEERGLWPSETAYVARTRDRRPLRFSDSGNPGIERAYRTHWVSPELSEAKRAALAERQSQPPDLVVIQALKDWTCTECSDSGELLIMEDPGPLCLACADLDHLVHLPSGNAALTRRAKKASRLSAVVVRFSRARRRYERLGVLVEEDALSGAEQECLAAGATRPSAHLAGSHRCRPPPTPSAVNNSNGYSPRSTRSTRRPAPSPCAPTTSARHSGSDRRPRQAPSRGQGKPGARYSFTRFARVAPCTVEMDIDWSKVTKRPSCRVANASR
jgi:hypothetical protein